MAFIIEFLLSGIAIAIAAWITPGVTVDGFWTAIVVGIVFALVNLVIGGMARFFTTPLNWITLGLVSFIITGLMVMLTGNLVDGFRVDGFLPALIFALLLGVIRGFFGMNEKK